VIRAVSVSSCQNRCSVPIVDLSSIVVSSPPVGVVGAGDPGSSRLVYAMVIGLVVVGIGLVLLAIWILRQTRPDLDVLAPLERMGDGDWKKRDPSTQRRMLDEVRPDGAQPLAAEPPPPPIDSDFEEADHAVASFSDLGPGLGGGVPNPTPVQADAGDSDDDADLVTDELVDDAPDRSADEPEGDAADESLDDTSDDAADAAEGDEQVDDAPDDAADELVDESTEQPGEDEADEQVDDALSDPRG